MKNIILFIALSSTIFLSSCTGEQGPPGGVDYSKVYEVTVGRFQYDGVYNQMYSNLSSFPFEVYESDVVLVYRLSGSDNAINPPADVWTQLPQSIFYQDGTGDTFQYNFNNTFYNIEFTIEGNFPLNEIATDDITNQTFRIAVVPSKFAKTNPSMQDIMELMDSNNLKLEIIK